MDDNNVTEMSIYRLAELIMENWLDSYSDSGAIFEASYKRLQAIKENVDPERWQKAVDLAHKKWPKV